MLAGFRDSLDREAVEDVRARYRQWGRELGEVRDMEVRAEVAERDERDATRATSPMVRADDAVEVDTTGLEPEQVVERIVALAGRAVA